MTELERLLTASLTKMEQDLTATQVEHAQILAQHEAELTVLQERLQTLEGVCLAQGKDLQELCAVYENLQGLLERLSSVLGRG